MDAVDLQQDSVLSARLVPLDNTSSVVLQHLRGLVWHAQHALLVHFDRVADKARMVPAFSAPRNALLGSIWLDAAEPQAEFAQTAQLCAQLDPMFWDVPASSTGPAINARGSAVMTST